jgi:hypothetical protein
MSSKLAFPQFALLEQNLQISHHVQDSCESQPQYKMPAYLVVKDLCVQTVRTIPLPAGRSLAFLKRGRSNKKPGVERRAKPSAHSRTGSRDARLFATLSSYPTSLLGGVPKLQIAPDDKLLFAKQSESIPDFFRSSSGASQTCEKSVNFFRAA